jgi:hypothetical protein
MIIFQMLSNHNGLLVGVLWSVVQVLRAEVPRRSPGTPRAASPSTTPAGVQSAHGMAVQLGTGGGAAISIDYGGAGSGAWTLRGILRHPFGHVPPLEAPGDVDLSADVDFAALAAAAEDDGGTHVHGPVAQGEFLGRMGPSALRELLTAPADAATRSWWVGEARRPVAPAEMSAAYKVLALTLATGRGRLVPPAVCGANAEGGWVGKAGNECITDECPTFVCPATRRLHAGRGGRWKEPRPGTTDCKLSLTSSAPPSSCRRTRCTGRRPPHPAPSARRAPWGTFACGRKKIHPQPTKRRNSTTTLSHFTPHARRISRATCTSVECRHSFITTLPGSAAALPVAS